METLAKVLGERRLAIEAAWRERARRLPIDPVDLRTVLPPLFDALLLAVDGARARRPVPRSEPAGGRRPAEGATALRDLEERIAARDNALSVAAHEIRNPLTALELRVQDLRGAIGRAGLGNVDPAYHARALETVDRLIRRVIALVDRLLDVARIAADRFDLELADVDLVLVVREAAEDLVAQLAAAGCTLSVRATKPVVGRWDRLRLEQIVTDLLSNAIKYGRGSPIEVTVAADRSMARLVVRDHGIGIPRAQHSRIFRQFERLDHDGHLDGLGLGLWITSEIVRALGGSIAVASKPGAGATFTVELPRGPKRPRPRQRIAPIRRRRRHPGL